MTEATIRSADPDRDAETFAAMVVAERDFILQNTVSMRHQLFDDNPMKRKLSLAAEIDGRVVGMAFTALDPENSLAGAAGVSLLVSPEHRRRGVGSALYDRLAAHWTDIGATDITGRLISGDGAAFVEKRGFARSRTERINHAVLADVPATPPLPEGITLKSLSELADARPLYDIDCATIVDIPADEPWLTLSYEEWRRQYLDDPRLDHDATVLAFDGDVPVAVAWLDRVGERVWSNLTGTRREYRGRGLAKVVKTDALRRARDGGATDAYTNNDATNAGMLAVNTWLGYRLHAEQFSYVRKL